MLLLSSSATQVGLAAKLVRSAETFTSGDKPIRIDVFEPKKSGKYPAIFFLHAEHGIHARKSLYERYAKKAAADGYAVFLVYYFDRTGTSVADKTTLNQQNFIAWMRTVADAVTFAATRPKVDPQRIGLLGISVGATLALSIATQDARIGAVVDFSGEMPDLAAQFMKRMAPTLILHGDADDVVPVEKAHKLERLLQTKNIPYEIKIYAREGHGFKTRVLKDAAARSLAFFRKNLNPLPSSLLRQPLFVVQLFDVPHRRGDQHQCHTADSHDASDIEQPVTPSRQSHHRPLKKDHDIGNG